MISVS